MGVGCNRRSVPKPYGYFRIAIPDTAYSRYAPAGYPYSFALSDNAVVHVHPHTGDRYWIDIDYPAIGTTIHCSYKPVQHNLRALSRDAQEFLYKHATVASAIPEQEFANAQEKVWGMYYELYGNTASPIQFYLTDSTAHFFRGALYCNAVPDQDSLAPVYDYMRQDIRHIIETFQWQTR